MNRVYCGLIVPGEPILGISTKETKRMSSAEFIPKLFQAQHCGRVASLPEQGYQLTICTYSVVSCRCTAQHTTNQFVEQLLIEPISGHQRRESLLRIERDVLVLDHRRNQIEARADEHVAHESEMVRCRDNDDAFPYRQSGADESS